VLSECRDVKHGTADRAIFTFQIRLNCPLCVRGFLKQITAQKTGIAYFLFASCLFDAQRTVGIVINFFLIVPNLVLIVVSSFFGGTNAERICRS